MTSPSDRDTPSVSDPRDFSSWCDVDPEDDGEIDDE